MANRQLEQIVATQSEHISTLIKAVRDLQKRVKRLEEERK